MLLQEDARFILLNVSPPFLFFLLVVFGRGLQEALFSHVNILYIISSNSGSLVVVRVGGVSELAPLPGAAPDEEEARS
jgi:hypothetical protein